MSDDKPRVVLLLGPEDSTENALRVLAERGVSLDAVITGAEAEAWVRKHGDPLPHAVTIAPLPLDMDALSRVAQTAPVARGDLSSLLYRGPKRSPDDTRARKARRKRQSKARRKNWRKH